MSEGKKSHIKEIVIGVIIAVISFVLIATLSKIWGWVPSIWEWLINTSTAFWQFIVSDIPVPVWMLSILVITMCFAAFQLFLNIRSSKVSHTPSAEVDSHIETEIVPVIELNDLEEIILRVMANEGERWIPANDFIHSMDAHKLKIEQALDSLSSKHLLEVKLNLARGQEYGLTKRGRDFIIREKYIE